MSDLSKKIVDLSPAKLELLARRLKEKGKESSQAQVIPRRSESVLFPLLSFAQQRLWVLDQLEPFSPAYNIYTAMRLSGRLDIDVLERALNEVIRRHETLRTTFGVFDDEPVQVIAEQLYVKVKLTDLRHLPEDEREAEVHRLATEGAKQPFDLTRGPLLHASWLQLGDESGVLLLTVHHIVFDGWSAGVFIREMVALYEAFSKGEPSPLAELPIQYADFSVWQRQKLQGEILERHVEYWKRQLGGAPPLLDLPTDRPRLSFQTYQGERLTFSFSDALIQQLKSLIQREGATLFMMLLSAFQIMLFRYTGQSRISVGTAIANRNRRELEPLIGFFANTLVLCTDLSGNPTFRELLSRVQEVTLGAYSHQDLPFEKVVDVLRPVRDLSHNPLFQVMFIFNTVPTASQNEKSSGIEDRKAKPPDLAAGLLSFDNRAIKRDLSLSLLERAEGVAGVLEYSTDLFDATTVSRMISHFTTLLEAIIAEPDRRISELSMLTGNERQQLLTESTGTKLDYQKDGCIHQLFEAQAGRTPDSVAVIFEDERLTYDRLNRRANQLARHLRALGVGPDTLVGIFMHRSLDVVISILGVLKAGGAYVPLDPAYPRERLNFVLEDAQPPVLLSHKDLMETGFDYQTEVVLLDADWREIAQHSEENLSNIAFSSNLAYVIYTSGSTGRPKGVTIPHATLTHYVQAMEIAVGITAGDCYLHTASTGFSSSVRQFMVPLSVGAAVVVATPEQIKDPLDLFDSVRRNGVTIMDIVPSYYRNCIQILASLTPESKADLLANKLRLILTASEPLWSDIVKNGSFEFDPGTRFINMFGQTETAGIVTVYPIPTVHEDRVKIVPIGKPIANTVAYVLDQYSTPAPIGVHGELCVGGPALARGYLNHSELTAEKFIPDPFNNEPGARLYRTGDLARYLPDGNIEFIGRSDRQVKIRGFRVEPEEIEAVLVEHPNIRAAVVIAHEYLPGNKRLVAYVVASQEPAPGVGELRDYLKKRLPEYMVPPSFLMLDELPVMPNGKVNRQALPALDQLRPDLETKLVDPRTPIEETLAGIWARVLGVERVGINDNFFELGGHSLLATQAISRVREAINVEVSLRHLFEHPTITGLADVVEAELRSGRELQSSPIRPVSRENNLPLSFAQQRLWFLDQLEPNSSFYNISSSVRLQGQLDVTALDRALNEVVRRHEVLRTRFAIVNDQPVQIIDHTFQLSLPVVDLSRMPESERAAEAERIAHTESQKPFDLATGPLVRATLVKIDQDDHAVIVVMHHIISDGWSRGVLIREVSALYKAYSAGERSPLSELPVQYADYAVWQREWLKGEVLDAELNYWKKQLEGAPPLLELPTDRPLPSVQTYRGAQQTIVVPANRLEKLEALSRREGVTLFMVLLAVFQILLARYSGQKDIVIGTPIAGRNRTELENLIGFFINTLVIRTDLRGNPSFQNLLRQVRAVSLESYAYQDLPLEKLIDEMKLRRDLSHTPLFQIMFALWTQMEDEVETTGLKSRGLGSDTNTAKFNLVLNMTRSRQGLGGVMRYNTDLFDEATIERMIRHFGNLIESVANDEEQQVMMIPLMTESERQELLTELNEVRQYPDHRCVHELFEQQAEERGDAVAVRFEDSQLTYKELNERANQLAHHLRSLGVAPDITVGLCLDRSLDLITGMLAILKAGGAYLPIDPTYPQDRIAFMLEDAATTVLISQDDLVTALPLHTAKLVLIDRDWHEIAQQSRENPQSESGGENLAYIIYTSGSTGRPKGVMVTHSNVVRLLRATEEKFGFRETDVWTMFHSASFDFSVWELWGGLCYGGKVVVVGYWVSRTTEAFYEMVEREGVTVLNQTPSAFGQFMQVDEERGGELRLRVVIFGGEALEIGRLRGWVERHGDEKPELVNMYGITETTVHVTYRRMRRREIEEGVGSVIGGGIADLRVYILDENRRVVPEGVGGEIYVGGRGLARGYKGRAELTAERFVPDPYGEAGGRLYKSGDRGRYKGKGEIEYLGRIDHQVKIRGFRIELGEIESVLSNHPQIDEVVVLAHAYETGEKRLIAYLVSNHIPSPSISDLRSFISQKLPEYMLPSQFIFLDSIPLTVNGKIDRRALPEPTRIRPDLDKQYQEPTTELERQLVGLWEQSLGVDQVGINDNFFELGGDSILAAIFINKLQEVIGEYVYVVAIFDAPTVAELSEYVVANYPHAVNRMCGIAITDEEIKGDEQIDERKIEQIRGMIKPLRRREGPAGKKNKTAVFVLSAPRSGSTLLRVMLGGHSQLFAPPELELLRFNTLEERREAFEGRDRFWLEGTLRAMMEAKGISLEEAREEMRRYEEEGMSVKEFYGEMQEWIGERVLVDKSPSYALYEEAMRRGEEDFEEARYIHLVRHPMGMIKSFEEAKLEQVFFQYEHEYGRRELAELIWVVSNENIGRFLEGIEEGRKVEVRYEEMVREPREVMERVCRVMGIEVEEEMLEPYKEKRKRMTDGVKEGSRMLGDVKFHEHTGIDGQAADRWKQMLKAADRLSDITWGLAETFEYERPVNEAAEIVKTGVQRLMPLKRVKPGQMLRLSYAQERLWFLDQLEPKSPFYNIAGAVRLRGELDPVALEETINEIVRQHEVLRTTFDMINGQPIQIINPAQRLTLQVLDLSGLLEQERESELKRLVAEEAQQPFDLAKGPLMRVRLISLGEGDNVILLTRHHIISDGWSLSILIREMSVLYEAFSTGKPSPLAELTFQYADYAHSQREWLQGEVLDKQLEYWKRQMAGAPPVLELPTDHPRPPVQSFNGSVESVVLPGSLSDGLKELSRKEGATLFMTLLAAFQAMLSRYSGQEKIVVGTPIASRNRTELENLIGLFLNTLALHTDLGGDPCFVELLHRVREVALGAYAHQDLPFEKIVEELQPARDTSRSPVFQVMFTLQNTPRVSIQRPGMKLNSVGGEAYTTKFDLSLAMMDREDGLVASLQYNTRLFEAATIKRMIGHFQTLLDSILSDPLLPLSLLPMLSPAERSQLLLDFNDTDSDFSRHLCIHHLFEAQVDRSPDAVALVFNDHRISYSELNQCSNQLAHYLQKLGVGPESLVGICLERSVEMVVSLLGILKAGGAYLPIDPYYPLDRISFMIEDSSLNLLLTQQQLLSLLGQQPADMVCIDSISPLLDQQPSSNPTCEVESRNAAYLIYTSGSTGRPKAVVIEHKSVVNFLTSMEQKLAISSEDVLVAVTTLSFDIAGLEIYLPLKAGARVEIASREEGWDGEKLAERLAKSKATMMQATPASWRMLMESGWRAERGFKVLCGGEGLAGELARQLKGSEAEVWNLYGPTETTIWSGGYEVEEEERGIMPVGRPIANTQIYVLGDRGEMKGIGGRGEIYIGGEGVGRGYAGRADQTAERFVPDGYSKRKGARMYRTGDEGRMREDGKIEFVGRMDNQVKVRGYRIELGEIEEVLRGLEEVREAVVVVREDGRGEKELVCYVVEEREGIVSREELIERVSKRLPEYMVPKKYVVMKELPLTGSGKVDRKALPTIDEGGTEIEEYIAARTPTEEKLAEIWGEVLKVERVGIRNNFFGLGGHSLLATQLISRVRDTFQIELPLLTVFKSSTVEALAEAIEIHLIQSTDAEQMLEMMEELEHLSQDEIEALLLSEDFGTD